MAKELTWKKAIEKVLAESAEPLHYREITERITADGLRTTVGATPAATVRGVMGVDIKKYGDESPYMRVAKGIFTLTKKPKLTRVKNRTKLPISIEEMDEEENSIVTSFGMFWQRDSIEWGTNPKVLGMQQIGATPVDFNKQLGVYLLYDGREVIYVGRSTERPLGRRLYEHTIDRMSARWDRFSWFGFLPVSDAGDLGKLPSTYDATKMIPAFEAILIEALEPRQNRKRGDDLAAVEYIQHADPAIKRKMVMDEVEKALSR